MRDADVNVLRMVPMTALAGLVVATTAGCGFSGGGAEAAGRARPAETSLPQGLNDPRVAPAVTIYRSFQLALIRAQQKPVAESSDLPDRADFTRYSFDPVTGEFEAAMRELAAARAEFRGTPPESHLAVTSVEADADPYPTVMLSDCQTGQEAWQAIDTATGKPLADQEPRVPRPYGVTVTMVYTQQHWGVKTMSIDTGRTCPD